MKGTATSKVKSTSDGRNRKCQKEFCNNVVIVERFVPNPDAVSCFNHIFYIPDLSKDPTTLKLLDLNIPKLVYNMYKPFGINY